MPHPDLSWQAGPIRRFWTGIKESPWLDDPAPDNPGGPLVVCVFTPSIPSAPSSGWFLSVGLVRPESVVPFAIATGGLARLLRSHPQRATPWSWCFSVLIAGAGIVLALAVYQWKKISADDLARRAGMLYRGASAKWYFDELYDVVFVKGTHVTDALFSAGLTPPSWMVS